MILSLIALVLLPTATNLAAGTLPESLRSHLWLVWPATILLAVPLTLAELRATKAKQTTSQSEVTSLGGDPDIWNIPQKTPHFTDRKPELLLAEGLRLNRTHTSILIHGMGGAGKTQLALALAEALRQHATIGWLVPSKNRVSIAASLAALGQQVGISASSDIDAARTVLQRLDRYPGWLLIFDDARSLPDFEGLLPTGGKGFTIFTSRSPVFERIAEPFLLEAFKDEIATQFLLDRSGQSDETVAAILARGLGGLPLALDNAGNYCRETGIDLSDYVQRYSTNKTALLDQGVAEGSVSLQATLRISFSRAAKTDPAAMELLTVLAFMAPADISRKLVTAAADLLPGRLAHSVTDPLRFDATIRTLTHSALLTSANPGNLRIHELVGDSIRDMLHTTKFGKLTGLQGYFLRRSMGLPASWNAQQWALTCIALLDRSLPDDDPRELESWGSATNLLPHATNLWGHLDAEDLTVHDLELLARVTSELGIRIFRRGHYRTGSALCRRAVDLYISRLPAEHPLAMRAKKYLALTLHGLGEPKAAESIYREVLRIQEHVLGGAAPETIGTKNDLGGVLMDDPRQLEQAMALYLEVVSTRQRELGDNDIRTLIAMNNLAKTYRLMGRLDEAEHLSRLVHIAGKENLGEKHPDVLVWANNLGEALREKCRFAEAEIVHRRTLNLRTATLGEGHPNSIISMSSLARVMVLRGDSAEARSLYSRALTLAEQELGTYHPLCQAIRQDLDSLPQKDDPGPESA